MYSMIHYIMYPSWLWQMMHRYCMYSIMYLYTPPGTGSWMPHWLLYCKLGRSFYHCLDTGKVYMVLHVQDLHRSLPRIYHTMLLKITPQFQTFTISLQHDGEHLQYFKVFIFDLADFKVTMIFYIHKKRKFYREFLTIKKVFSKVLKKSFKF